MPIEILGLPDGPLEGEPEAIGVAPTPKKLTWRRQRWLALSRAERVMVAIVPLAVILVCVTGARYWQSHHPLTALAAGYDLAPTVGDAGKLDDGRVTYTAHLNPTGGYEVSLRKLVVSGLGGVLDEVVVQGQHLTPRDGVVRPKTAMSNAVIDIILNLRVAPEKCAALPQVVDLTADAWSHDRRHHVTHLQMSRFPFPFQDPLLDPVIFPGVCPPPHGSLFELPTGSLAGLTRLSDNVLTLPTGKDVTVGAPGSVFSVAKLRSGYLVEGNDVSPDGLQTRVITDFSSTGRQVWSRHVTEVGGLSADLRYTLVTGGNSIEIVDVRNGKTIESLSLPTPPGRMSWAGSTPIVNIYDQKRTRAVLYAWDRRGHRLTSPIGLLPDEFRLSNRVRDYPRCSNRDLLTVVFGPTKGGVAGIASSYLGTSDPNVVGPALLDPTKLQLRCPFLTIIADLPKPVAVEGFPGGVIELTSSAHGRLALPLPAFNELLSVSRGSDHSWVATVLVPSNPLDYRTPDSVGTGSNVVVMTIRCEVGASCQRLDTQPLGNNTQLV